MDKSLFINGKATPFFRGIFSLARWKDLYSSSPSSRNTLSESDNSNRALDAKCSGQQNLATVLEVFQYNRSDSLGVNPPLY
jgi:hypothetical protein